MDGLDCLDYGRMGLRIRQARKKRGWSQQELAKRCGISVSFLGHIERGTRIMSLETFSRICTALDADAGELLWGMARLLNTRGGGRMPDSYAMYIRIMESVAEILND